MNSWRKETIDEFILNLKDWYLKDNRSQSYFGAGIRNSEERAYLNANIHLDELIGTHREYVLNKLLDEKKNNSFTAFLLMNPDIDIEVNSINKEGKSSFQLLLENIAGSTGLYRHHLIDLYKRGYKSQKSDNDFLTLFYKNNIKSQELRDLWYFARILYKLNDIEKIEKVPPKEGLIFSILSFKQKQPIGINYPNLLSVANYALQYHRQNGDLILKAMKHYDVYDEVKQKDRKGTFKLKEEEYNQFKPVQDNDMVGIVFELFPELNQDKRTSI